MKFIFAILLAAALRMAAAQGPESTYRVRSGESLAAIANALIAQEAGAGNEKPSVAQRMVAIYRANPKAFAGSMNQLLDGSELRLPSPEEIAAVNPISARLELADQTSEYLASKPRAADTSLSDPPQVAQVSEEQVIVGLQKALRRKERELTALRAELEGRREPLPLPNAGSLAAAPASGTVNAKVEVKGNVGEAATASAAPTSAGLAARGVFSPGGLAVAGAVALLGGFGLLWTLRGRGQAVRSSAEFTDVTDVTDVPAASNSVVEAEVMRRMPDLSGFSGLGSATPRARDPNA
jgi:FimV-like protein